MYSIVIDPIPTQFLAITVFYGPLRLLFDFRRRSRTPPRAYSRRSRSRYSIMLLSLRIQVGLHTKKWTQSVTRFLKNLNKDDFYSWKLL